MSLDFRLNNIKDFQTVCWEWRTPGVEKDGKKLNPLTEGLIWSTMAIGLGEITEKNIDEWMARLAITDKLFGTMSVKWDGEKKIEMPYTREELVMHIGLTTNVTNEKRPSWLKRTTTRFMEETDYKLQRAARQRAEEEAKKAEAA